MPSWDDVAKFLGYDNLEAFEAEHGKTAEEKNEQILREEARGNDLYAYVEEWTAKWSSPRTHEHDLDRFEIILKTDKGRKELTRFDVQATGDIDIGNIHPDCSPSALADRYVGMALIFRRWAGKDFFEQPFEVRCN